MPWLADQPGGAPRVQPPGHDDSADRGQVHREVSTQNHERHQGSSGGWLVLRFLSVGSWLMHNVCTSQPLKDSICLQCTSSVNSWVQSSPLLGAHIFVLFKKVILS